MVTARSVEPTFSERLHQHTRCSKSCPNSALPLTRPPRCAQHVRDPDRWFISATSQAKRSGGPDSRMHEPFLHGCYVYGLLRHPALARVNANYERRVSRGRQVEYRFDDFTLFIIVAAGSGIIGNLAYDALKALVRRVVPRRDRAEAERVLESVVTESKYTAIRRSESSDGRRTSVSVVERRLRRRYNLIVVRTKAGRRSKR